jgi:hypothetical protein
MDDVVRETCQREAGASEDRFNLVGRYEAAYSIKNSRGLFSSKHFPSLLFSASAMH